MMETARLSLRDWQEDDVDVLTRELANFRITRNTGSIPHPYTKTDAIAYIARLKLPVDGALHQAIILTLAPREIIGGIGLYADPQKGTCELGYWLAEAHWGHGYALEAAQAVIAHAFDFLHHTAINACFHDDNPASGKILYRLGFQTIGPCEKFSKAQGKLVSVANTKLTKEQWLAHKKL